MHPSFDESLLLSHKNNYWLNTGAWMKNLEGIFVKTFKIEMEDVSGWWDNH